MDELSEMMYKEAKAQVEALDDVPIASEEMSKAVTDLEKIHRMIMEAEKFRADQEEKELQRKLEAEQEARRRKERIVDVGLKVFEIGGPLALTAATFVSGLKFEQSGTYTSFTVKNALRWITPWRKK